MADSACILTPFAISSAGREGVEEMTQRVILASVVGALLIALGVGGGYLLGTHRPDATVLTGTFYTGYREASAQVDGFWYGIVANVSEWEDAAGTWHQDGWPNCLNRVGYHTITFGYVPVSLPSGASWREVVWVSCGSA